MEMPDPLLFVEVRPAINDEGNLVHHLAITYDGETATYEFENEADAKAYAAKVLDIPRS